MLALNLEENNDSGISKLKNKYSEDTDNFNKRTKCNETKTNFTNHFKVAKFHKNKIRKSTIFHIVHNESTQNSIWYQYMDNHELSLDEQEVDD